MDRHCHIDTKRKQRLHRTNDCTNPTAVWRENSPRESQRVARVSQRMRVFLTPYMLKAVWTWRKISTTIPCRMFSALVAIMSNVKSEANEALDNSPAGTALKYGAKRCTHSCLKFGRAFKHGA